MKKYWLLGLSIINAVASAVYIACSSCTTVPIHWNIYGQADGFMPKWFNMVLPGIVLIIGISHVVAKMIMEKNQDKNIRYADKIMLFMFLMMTVISWLFISLSMNRVTKLGGIVNTVILMILGAAFVFIGNIMPKIAQNGWIGVRTASTMSDENVWRKTNKLGGYLGVVCGFLLIVLGVVNATLGREDTLLLFVGIGLVLVMGAIIPTVYAVIIAKKIKTNK
ncbi:MAG: SdpI family protein [Ruminococcus sp.]|nr:SdpI family protein [Ruminococcus sp.]